MRDIIALITTLALALIWLRLIDFLAIKGLISSQLSRKIIHIGTGPIYVLCWLLFTDAWYTRYLAALVPLAITIQFILVGFGVIKDEASVRAMSRTGERKEILRGPLFYGIIFVLVTVLYWRENPIGITALMILCGGDGFADIFGRRFGKTKLAWNQRKSWIGSLAMFLGGWILALVILLVFYQAGYLNYNPISLLLGVTLASFGATIIESISPPDYDNVTITLTSILLSQLFW